MILEVEKRDTPWTAFLDVGGMKRCAAVSGFLLRWADISLFSFFGRVLLNICGNALSTLDPSLRRWLPLTLPTSAEFTQRGHVKVRLQELPVDVTGDMTPTGQRLIGIDIEDTVRCFWGFLHVDARTDERCVQGCGMSPDFLRDGKLWQAFVQEDSFS